MTTAELKNSLIKEIDATKNKRTLELLLIALENINTPMPELTEWQLKRLKESEEQFERGEFIIHEEVNKKIQEWLNK